LNIVIFYASDNTPNWKDAIVCKGCCTVNIYSLLENSFLNFAEWLSNEETSLNVNTPAII